MKFKKNKIILLLVVTIWVFNSTVDALGISYNNLRNQLLCARYNNPSRIVTMAFWYDAHRLISRIHENLIKIPYLSQVQPDIFTTLEAIRKEVDAIFTPLEATDYYYGGRLRISPSKQYQRIASLKNALQCARTLRNAMDFFPPDVPLSEYYNFSLKLAISNIDNLIETLDYGIQLLAAGLTEEHPLVKYLALRYQKIPGVTIKNYLGPDMRTIDEVTVVDEVENIIDAFLDFLKKESLHPDIYILLYKEGDNLIIELEYDGNVQTEPVLPFYYLRSILGAQASIEHLTIAGYDAIFKPLLEAGIWQGAAERLESRIAIKKCYPEIKKFIDRLSSIIDEIDGCIRRNENINADSRSYKWLREYNFSAALAKRLGLLNQQKGIPPYYEGGEIRHVITPIIAMLEFKFELGKLLQDTDIELLRSRLQNASMLFERIVHDKLTYPGIRVTIKFPFITPQEAEVMERFGCAARRNAHGKERFNVYRFLRLIDICSNLLSTSDISQVKECAQDCQALSQQWSEWLSETIGKISYLSKNNRLITKEKRVEVIQNIERIIREYTQIKERIETLLKDINTSSDKTTSSLLLELSEHINLFLKNLQSQIEVATGTPSQELQPIVRLIQERYGQGKIPCITIDDNRVNPDTQVRINGISLEIALNNIVNNALYFAEKRQKETGIPAEVRIVIYEEKGNLVIEISDNGEGIPPQALAINPETGRQYIFDINYSLRPGGTGQGLTDASYVFKDAGGSIRADSMTAEEYDEKLALLPTITIGANLSAQDAKIIKDFYPDIEKYMNELINIYRRIIYKARQGEAIETSSQYYSWLNNNTLRVIIAKRLQSAGRSQESGSLYPIAHLSNHLTGRLMRFIEVKSRERCDDKDFVTIEKWLIETEHILNLFERIAKGKRFDIGTTFTITLPIYQFPERTTNNFPAVQAIGSSI